MTETQTPDPEETEAAPEETEDAPVPEGPEPARAPGRASGFVLPKDTREKRAEEEEVENPMVEGNEEG